MDFALNSLLIISSDNQGVLPLRNVPHLMDVMLAHVGVFSKGRNGWMDGWRNGWMNGWMDGWMDEWMDGWMDG